MRRNLHPFRAAVWAAVLNPTAVENERTNITALKKEVSWDYARPLIEPERLTLPELLRDQGYTTA